MGKQEVQVVISGNASPLFKTLGEASKATEGMAKEMEAAAGGLKNLLMGFAAPLAALGGILGGGALLRNAVHATADLGDELAKASQKAGVSVEALSGLRHAAKLADVEFESLVGGLAKLAKTMQDSLFTPTSISRAAFKALGIDVQTASGALKDTDVVLEEVAEKFHGMRDGAGKTALAMNLFGKSGAELIPLLNEGKEGIAKLRAEAERLGITMTTEQAQAAEEYKDNLERVDTALLGIKMRIGNELIPALSQLNEDLVAFGPSIGSGISDAFNGLYQVILGGREQVEKAIVAVGAMWDLASERAKLGLQSLKAAVRLDLDEVMRLEKAYADFYKNRKEESKKDLAEIEDRYADKMMGLMGLGPKKSPKPDDGKKNAPNPNPPSNEQDKEFERLRAALEKERYEYEKAGVARGEYLEYKKSQEAAYWKNVLDTADLSEKTRAKAQQEYYKAARAELKKNHDDNKAMGDAYRERDLAAQRAMFDAETAELGRMLAQGRISEQQALNWKRAIEDEKYAFEKAALEDRLAVKGIEPIEIAKINGEIEALEARHRAKLQELKGNQVGMDQRADGWAGAMRAIEEFIEKSQNKFELWRGFVTEIGQGVTNGIANAMSGLITGQMTLGQSMKALWKDISGSVVQALSKMAAQELVLLGVQKAKAAWAEIQAAMERARVAKQLALHAAANQTEIAMDQTKRGEDATTAGQGFFAAFASIPFGLGIPLAIAAIALMAKVVSSITARAVGGRVDRPELTLLGEAGPEIVAPESSFQDYTRSILRLGANLGANLSAADAQVVGYGRKASSYATASARAGAPAGAQGPTEIHIHQNAPVWDPSQRGLRGMGENFIDSVRAAATERNVVLRPGMLGAI